MDALLNLWNFLQGKKTYIVALVTAAVGMLEALGHPVSPGLLSILSGLGLLALRSAISRPVSQ